MRDRLAREIPEPGRLAVGRRGQAGTTMQARMARIASTFFCPPFMRSRLRTGSSETCGQQLLEGAAPMAGRVFLAGFHLAEATLGSGRHEDRIVAEAPVAARRPAHHAVHPAQERVRMPVRPADAQRADEPGTTVRLLGQSGCTRAMAPAKSLPGPAHRAESTPGAPPSAATQKPELSESAGSPLARAAASALIRAFPAKSGASSGRRTKPSSAAETTPTPQRTHELLDLRDLAPIVARDHQPRPRRQATSHSAQPASAASRWIANSASVPRLASARSSSSCASLNGARSAVPWISTIPPAPVSTKLASASALEFLRVVEIEHRLAARDPAGHRRDLPDHRHTGQHVHPDQVTEGEVKRDPGPGDGGAPRAAIGVQHVAIERDRHLAHRHAVHHGPQAAPDQALDLLVRPDCLPRAASRSPLVWVARGSIPYSAVTQPWPASRRNRGTRPSTLAAHSTSVAAHPYEAGPFRVPGEARGQRNGAQGIGGAAADGRMGGSPFRVADHTGRLAGATGTAGGAVGG